MKILNSYVYKNHLIWKFKTGYQVEDTNGTYYTLKEARQAITDKV